MGGETLAERCVKARCTSRLPNDSRPLVVVNTIFSGAFYKSRVLETKTVRAQPLLFQQHRKRGGKRSWLCSQNLFPEQNGVNSLVPSVANTKVGSSICKFLVRTLGPRSKDERWPSRGSSTNAMGPHGTRLS